MGDTMIRWFASFGMVPNWVSDRGPHLRLLKEKNKSAHHFMIACCTWSNGTVEVVCRELLRTCRTLLSEYQLPHSCWPTVLPVVQSVLKNTVLERPGNRCPLTVFREHEQNSPLTTITRKIGSKTKVLDIGTIHQEQLKTIESTYKALDEMHKDVAERTGRNRRHAVASHNQRTNVPKINFNEGDYVLRGVLQGDNVRGPSLK